MSDKWAPPTWRFFHVFAEKINPEYYRRNAARCLGLVKGICASLPCPDCRQHAVSFMRVISPRHVPTKEAFKSLIFLFHNYVNRRLGKRIFRRADLSIYRKANLGDAVNSFLGGFTARYGNIMQSGRFSTHGARIAIARQITRFFRGQYRGFQA